MARGAIAAVMQVKMLFRRLLALLRRHRAAILGVYVMIELRAYLRHQALALWLASFRTPLSLAFPRLEWRRVFASRLSVEARARPTDLRIFVESIFWNRSLSELTRPAIEKWLRMYLSTFEDQDRPLMWSRGSFDFSHVDINQQKEMTTVAKELNTEAQHLCCLLEDSFKCTFPDGPEQDFIRINSPVSNHTPPTPMFHPLPLRISKVAFRVGAHMIFRQLGFVWSRDEATGMEFWFRSGHGPGLLFLHGFGFGLAPYTAVIWELAFRYRGPLLLGDLPVLGGSEPRSVGTPFPRAEEIATSIEHMKEVHAIRTLNACGHSLGGIMLSAIMKYKPDLFTRVAFVESPVFFFRSTDGWPFIFRPHSITSFLDRVRRLEFRDLAGDIFLSDPWQQHVIHHGLWFFEYCSFEQDLNENTLVVLGERDRLASIKLRDWLAAEHPSVQVETHTGDHGDIVLPQNVQWFVEKLVHFCARGGQQDKPAGMSRSESASRLAAGLLSTCLPLPRSESGASLSRCEH